MINVSLKNGLVTKSVSLILEQNIFNLEAQYLLNLYKDVLAEEGFENIKEDFIQSKGMFNVTVNISGTKKINPFVLEVLNLSKKDSIEQQRKKHIDKNFKTNLLTHKVNLDFQKINLKMKIHIVKEKIKLSKNSKELKSLLLKKDSLTQDLLEINENLKALDVSLSECERGASNE